MKNLHTSYGTKIYYYSISRTYICFFLVLYFKICKFFSYIHYYINGLRLFYIQRMKFYQSIHWSFFNYVQFNSKFTGNFS